MQTLQSLIDRNFTVTVHCVSRLNHTHWVKLDLQALCEKYGPETDIHSLKPRLVCSECGGREVEFTFSPHVVSITEASELHPMKRG